MHLWQNLGAGHNGTTREVTDVFISVEARPISANIKNINARKVLICLTLYRSRINRRILFFSLFPLALFRCLLCMV